VVIEEDVEIEKREGEQVYIPVEHRGKLETALGEEQGGTGAWGRCECSDFSAGDAVRGRYHEVKSSHELQSLKLLSRHPSVLVTCHGSQL